MLWPKIAKIYWDPEHNVPLLMPQDKSQEVFKLNLTEPGDARPTTEYDIERLKSGISYEFNSIKLFNRFFRGRFMLFNKVPHWDQMWEVIASGNVLGQLYYDPFHDTWRFRLNSTGALLAYKEGLVDHIVVDKYIREKSVVKQNYSSSSRQILLVDHNGKVKGIGENINGTVVEKFLEKSLNQRRLATSLQQ